MKRSEVNRYIKQAIKLFDENNFQIKTRVLKMIYSSYKEN